MENNEVINEVMENTEETVSCFNWRSGLTGLAIAGAGAVIALGVERVPKLLGKVKAKIQARKKSAETEETEVVEEETQPKAKKTK